MSTVAAKGKAVWKIPLTAPFCYRLVLKQYKNTRLTQTADNKIWRSRVRHYFETGIPGKTKDEALSIAFEYGNAQASLDHLSVNI